VTSNAAWLDALEAGAPDVVALFRLFADGERLRLRRELRRRAGAGTALDLGRQLGVVATALGETVAALPEPAFSAPGGEADWTVAEALGHTVEARRGLTLAAALAAAGRWPAQAPAVVPSVPGAAGGTRAELLARLARSQAQVERAAATIAGHEEDPCPLDHPLVSALSCGEWLLFAGVHDLMHLEQLHRLLSGETAG
jgi:hypothetical protein